MKNAEELYRKAEAGGKFSKDTLKRLEEKLNNMRRNLANMESIFVKI